MPRRAKRSDKEIFYAYYAPIILWMAAIFLVSSIPGDGEWHAMRPVTYTVRKLGHVVEYAVLGFLLARLFFFHFHKQVREACALAFLAGLIYAMSDEIHQMFVFGRQGKFTDVMIDGVGLLLGMWALVHWRTRVARGVPDESAVTEPEQRVRRRRLV